MKRLNIEIIEQRLEELGLCQSDLVKEIDTSRQSVSNWLTQKKFPRPAKLLKLAKALKLSFDEIILKENDAFEPIIAFRKKGNHKITLDYIEDAKDKGFLLTHLVPYLPYDSLSQPPILKDPSLGYAYIQQVAETVRKEIGKANDERIDFTDLIDFFNTNHAVIIPVFGGHKKNHENALNVFLPASMTTWIYLNLDSKFHDFKFWMAHELGHVKAPSLREDEAEDFADKFAGSLLVSQELAKREYIYIKTLSGARRQVARIIEIAEDLQISPLTVYFEIKRYAEHAEKPIIDLESDKTIYKANTVFCSKYLNVTESLFEKLPPSPKNYIKKCEEVFETPFFGSLKRYVNEQKKSANFLQAVMSLSPVDAQALYEEIC